MKSLQACDAGRAQRLSADRFNRPLGQRIIGAIARMNFWYLLTHRDSRLLRAWFAFFNGGLSIGLLCLLAKYFDWGLIFPPLGPTAFLFFYTPAAVPAAPRSAIIGHLSALAAGWAAVLAVGALFELPTGDGGQILLSWPRIAAVALSMGLASASMIVLRAPHPPAAGTALIVSMGLMTEWTQSLALVAGLALLVTQGFVINRLAGLRFPLWAPFSRDQGLMIAHALHPGEGLPETSLYGDAASKLGVPSSAPRRGPGRP